jgi:hypothetical protein
MIFGGAVNAQQTAAGSEDRFRRTKRCALSCSGCHGEGRLKTLSSVAILPLADKRDYEEAGFEGGRKLFDPLRGLMVPFAPTFEILPGTSAKATARALEAFVVPEMALQAGD